MGSNLGYIVQWIWQSKPIKRLSREEDFLWDLYRIRSQDLYGNSITVIIHSLDRSLFVQLIDSTPCEKRL